MGGTCARCCSSGTDGKGHGGAGGTGGGDDATESFSYRRMDMEDSGSGDRERNSDEERKRKERERRNAHRTGGGAGTAGVVDVQPQQPQQPNAPSQSDPPSPISVVALDLDYQMACVRNGGAAPVHMRGWSLSDPACLQHEADARNAGPDQIFRFPDDLLLGPGDSVAIYCGPDAVDACPLSKSGRYGAEVNEEGEKTHHLFWNDLNMWCDFGDTALIINPAGIIVHKLKVTG